MLVYQILESPKSTTQALYQGVFIFWLLSFDKSTAAKLSDIIPYVVTVAKQKLKEKLTRISLALFRNLSVHGKNIERMIESRLEKQIEIWHTKKWADEDIVSDLSFLQQKLAQKIEEMSSFERYRAELVSGELEWTPAHFSETFWTENIHFFTENNFSLIRILSELVSSPTTKSLSRSIACFDLGEFVRLHPHGKKILSDLGTKNKIMLMLSDTTLDADVQKQVLLCTRKMLISNWESSVPVSK